MNIEHIKKLYKKGMKVRLISMKGEPQMTPGLEGTIELIDDIGQLHIKWQNGSGLALNLECDKFEIIEEDLK